MNVSSSQESDNVKALQDGDPIPNLKGYLDQKDVDEYLEKLIRIDDEGNTVANLEDNQVLYLFELGTSCLNSSAADFQDLVILATFNPPSH